VASGEPLGLIAGNGSFPRLVAQAAQRRGRRVVAVGLREETAPELEAQVDEFHWVSLGQLGRCLALLKQARVKEAIMAGQVKHRQIFSGALPDWKMLGLMTRLATKSTDSIIGAVAEVLAQEGITLLSSVAFLEDQLAVAGAMTRRKPSADERRDIDYGVRIARALGGLDLGQTVAVKERAAVALEAMEGTDEVIRRAGQIAGPGATVIKLAKPRQDMRFDVPVVGPATLEAMREAGAGILAVEARKTLLIEKDDFLAQANKLGIAVWGLEPES